MHRSGTFANFRIMPTQPRNADIGTYDFFTPVARDRISWQLLRDTISALREAVETCLSSRPQPDSIPAISVHVCGERFWIPNRPGEEAFKRLRIVMERLGPLKRSDVPIETVNALRRMFAALFAWGHLEPVEDWRNQIQYSPTEGTVQQANEQYVQGVIRNFLSGNAAEGGEFFVAGTGSMRLCFDTGYGGMLERVLCDHCGLGGSELSAVDRQATAASLLEKYPSLKAMHSHPQEALEAAIEYVCRGA